MWGNAKITMYVPVLCKGKTWPLFSSYIFNVKCYTNCCNFTDISMIMVVRCSPNAFIKYLHKEGIYHPEWKREKMKTSLLGPLTSNRQLQTCSTKLKLISIVCKTQIVTPETERKYLRIGNDYGIITNCTISHNSLFRLFIYSVTAAISRSHTGKRDDLAQFVMGN